jgi:hypothetical protein
MKNSRNKQKLNEKPPVLIGTGKVKEKLSFKIKELEDKGYKIVKKYVYKEEEKLKVKYLKIKDNYGHDFYLSLNDSECECDLPADELTFTTPLKAELPDSDYTSIPEVEGVQGMVLECNNSICFLKNSSIDNDLENYYLMEEDSRLSSKSISPFFSYEFILSDPKSIKDITSAIEKKVFLREFGKNEKKLDCMIRDFPTILEKLKALRSDMNNIAQELLESLELLESWDEKYKELNEEIPEDKKILEENLENINKIAKNISWRLNKLSELLNCSYDLAREKELFMNYFNKLLEIEKITKENFKNLDSVIE